MIPDHKTNKLYFSGTLKECCREIATDVEVSCNEFGYKVDYLDNTNDVWARDFMPIQITKDRFLQYDYDPDYLKPKSKRRYKTNPDDVLSKLDIKTIRTKIILDGGNVVKSEKAVILTDKIYKENEKRFSKSDLIKELYNVFEVEKVIIIPKDKYCKYGHADGMLRFIDKDTVLISGFYEKANDKFKKALLDPLEKANLNINWLRVAENEKVRYLYYINFLQTKDFILVPEVDKKTDEIAVQEIAKHYRDYISTDRIRTINMDKTIKWGGALNCVSWNILE